MLEFTGQLSVWTGLGLACLFAAGTWLVYRRESRRASRFAFALPVLRVLVVALILLMLTGPSLRHRTHIGEPGRVVVFIDGSDSMAMTDPHMEVARKILIARAAGFLAEDAIDPALYDLAQRVRHARLQVDESLAAGDKLDLHELATKFRDEIAAVHEKINDLDAARFPAGDASSTGSILREYWLDLPGDQLADFTGSPRFEQPPTGSHRALTFEAPADLGDHYATRFRGYIHPPIDGDYTFFLASDGPSELWLSAGEDPVDKRRIARVTLPVKRWEWKNGEAQSAPVRLRGGRRYYIETIHKAGEGADHCAVGWQLPIGAMERPIPGKRLSPFAAMHGGTPQERRDSLRDSLRSELLDPLTAFLARTDIQTLSQKNRTDLAALTSIARRWESALETIFESQAKALAADGDPALTAALNKVDQMSRWQRISLQLLGDEGLAKRLEDRHQIEIYATHDRGATLLWSSAQQTDRPISLEQDAWSQATDLTAGLRDHLTPLTARSLSAEADDESPQRTTAILLSDGRHNRDDADPLAAATVLNQRNVPLHTVGVGSLTRPEDLSVRSIEAPDTVFHEDRIQGEIVIDDDMPPGKPFILRLELGTRIVWQKQLVTDRAGLRRLPFDLSVKELLAQTTASRAATEVKRLSVPLPLTASVTSIEGESETGNNLSKLTIHAVTEPRRMLILEGRPRWEVRYIRNLFTRDQRWRVNTLLAGVSSIADHWRRGEEEGAFPRDLQTLYQYDVILLGDLPTDMLMPDELERLRDFVGERGGGLIFIDGQRGHLRRYLDTPLGELLPIDWLDTGTDTTTRPSRLKLTAVGQGSTACRLLSDELENATLWQELMPPHWMAKVKPLPGASVLAQAVVGDETWPAIVERHYGAGKVVYLAFDESWRWRHEVADRHHARFWNQLARDIAEQPYAVQDQFVKLDAGSATYAPGDKAEIRARLRDREGKPMLHAKASALIHRDGRRIATLPLEAGDNRSGAFRGQTAPLEPGNYEVSIAVQGLNDADLKARATFTVEAPLSLERRAVTMDESTLQAMAGRASGRYYREEDLPRLIERLEPASRGRIVVTETELWRSWWWFVPIMLLLTMEWILRKRAGLL